MFPPVLGTVYPSLFVLVKRECLSEAENSQIACTFTFGIPTVMLLLVRYLRLPDTHSIDVGSTTLEVQDIPFPIQ